MLLFHVVSPIDDNVMLIHIDSNIWEIDEVETVPSIQIHPTELDGGKI